MLVTVFKFSKVLFALWWDPGSLIITIANLLLNHVTVKDFEFESWFVFLAIHALTGWSKKSDNPVLILR